MKEDAEYLKKILPLLTEAMSYKWRVQSFSKIKPEATCVAYIDARDLQDRLDAVCEYGWERDHKVIKDNIYAGIGVWMPSGDVQWRWDCGTESSTEKEKGESSDSFKRAGINWGVGRFLYNLKIVRLPANKKKVQGEYPHVVDSRGNQVWDLTAHINGNKVDENVKTVFSDSKVVMCVMEFDEQLSAAKTHQYKKDIWAAHWEDVKPQCGPEELEKFRKIYEKDINVKKRR